MCMDMHVKMSTCAWHTVATSQYIGFRVAYMKVQDVCVFTVKERSGYYKIISTNFAHPCNPMQGRWHRTPDYPQYVWNRCTFLHAVLRFVISDPMV
jgi:hypothetical protein